MGLKKRWLDHGYYKHDGPTGLKNMKKLFLSIPLILFVFCNFLFAQRITESLTGWTLGTNQPTVPLSGSAEYRDPPAGYGGSSIYVPVSTNLFYYPASVTGGEGSITFFVYDPGKCLDPVGGNYDAMGPGWGVLNGNSKFLQIKIYRGGSMAGCTGYEMISGLIPASPFWFFTGVRGSGGQAFAPGWYKWTIEGNMDEISFILYDVYTKGPFGGGTLGGDPNVPDWHWGDVTANVNSSTIGFWGITGSGWTAFSACGDACSPWSNGNGIEDISIFIVSGTGIFSGAGDGVPVQKEYRNESWGNIKALFK
jgi:hypothetical protein